MDQEKPIDAKRLARKYEAEFGDAEYWRIWHEERKLNVMRKGIWEKFRQNPDMAEKLLKTGDAIIIEDSPRDNYWGGILPNSCNMLGNLLMELRHFLLKKKAAVKLDEKPEIKPETKPEIKAPEKPIENQEIKPEVKSEVNPAEKQETK